MQAPKLKDLVKSRKLSVTARWIIEKHVGQDGILPPIENRLSGEVSF